MSHIPRIVLIDDVLHVRCEGEEMPCETMREAMEECMLILEDNAKMRKLGGSGY